MEKEIAEMERQKEEKLKNEIVEQHSPERTKSGKQGKMDSASESGFSNMQV